MPRFPLSLPLLCHATPFTPFPSSSSAPVLIDSLHHIPTLLSSLSQSTRIGIDTEFMSGIGYLESLETVQLATTEGINWVMDVRKIDMEDETMIPKILKKVFEKPVVLHASGVDLRLLGEWSNGGRPMAGVFDTQIAANLLKWNSKSAAISLKDLVMELLGKKLDKNVTRSNWSKRPLSDVQIEYAANDVRYLFEIQDLIVKKVIEMKREVMFEEYLSTVKFFPDDVPWKLNLRSRLKTPQGLFVFREIAIWRKKLAKETNSIPTFLLKNDALLSIAMFAESDDFQTVDVNSLKPMQIAKFLADIEDLGNLQGQVFENYKSHIMEAIKRGWLTAQQFRLLGEDADPEAYMVLLDQQKDISTLKVPRKKEVPELGFKLVDLALEQICEDAGVKKVVITGEGDEYKRGVADFFAPAQVEKDVKLGIFDSSYKRDILPDEFFELVKGNSALKWDPEKSKLILFPVKNL